jgi:hypothetical protein
MNENYSGGASSYTPPHGYICETWNRTQRLNYRRKLLKDTKIIELKSLPTFPYKVFFCFNLPLTKMCTEKFVSSFLKPCFIEQASPQLSISYSQDVLISVVFPYLLPSLPVSNWESWSSYDFRSVLEYLLVFFTV